MAGVAGWSHKYRPTKPWVHPSTGRPRGVIYMDDETYAEIDAAAKKNNCTFSAQALLFIEVGIETMALESGDA